MNKLGKYMLSITMLCLLILLVSPASVSGNSAEPPSLVILVNNPPDDLTIVLLSNEKHPEANVKRAAWEGYYIFYSSELRKEGNNTLKITTKEESFECKIEEPLLRYNNIYTLNLSKQELTPGEYPFRSFLLITIRILLTLLIEGAIFWLFGFRDKRSWVIFLIINLVTQGLLNIWLNGESLTYSGYLIFGLIIGEFFVFIVEMVAFPLCIIEYKKIHCIIYAFIANLISLVAGANIFTYLPV